MIKGVNKKIIEINNPDSLYFEKAVLYIRPNVSILPEAISQKEAQRLLYALLPSKKRKRKLSKNKTYILTGVIILLIIILLIIL
jgi:hypothetical protein